MHKTDPLVGLVIEVGVALKRRIGGALRQLTARHRP